MQLTPDIAYLPAGRNERLDLYRPDGAAAGEKRPAVVIVHGGGWKIGDKADAREKGMVQTLVEAGYVCASVNYLLYTDERPSWPTCIEDCRTAVRFLRQHAAEYGIDPQRIGAIGGSAGGCLSLLLGAKEASPAAVSARVQAVVALYPPTDMLTWGDRVPVFGFSKTTHPHLHRAASPLHQITPDFPPTLLMHGTADQIVPHSQSQSLDEAMTKMGIPHELVLVEGAPHTFRLQQEGIDVRKQVVSFFGKALREQQKKAAVTASR